RGELFPGSGEGLLGEILGPVDVAGQVDQEAIHRLVVGTHQLRTGLGTTGTQTVEQASVVPLRHGYSAGWPGNPHEWPLRIGRTSGRRCWRKMNRNRPKASQSSQEHSEGLGTERLLASGRKWLARKGNVSRQFLLPFNPSPAWGGVESGHPHGPEA